MELLALKELTIRFPVKKGLFKKTRKFLTAVDHVTLAVKKGESFGLVGESGSGKTTLGRGILNLVRPDSGEVFFMEERVDFRNKRDLRRLREKVQIVFQDPFSSLNPRKTVGSMLLEPLMVHKKIPVKEAMKKAALTLLSVGLKSDDFYKYPHEFSGGQRQRIGIARSLILEPECIILDEPVSSLDVSVQAQILNLLKELQKKFRLTYLFIAHNLNVVRFFCDRVAVMYAGRIMESAPSGNIFEHPAHPYTRLLLSSIPAIDNPKDLLSLSLPEADRALDRGQCLFLNRCPERAGDCESKETEMRQLSGDHYVRCVKKQEN